VGHDYFKEPQSLLVTREGEVCMKYKDHHISVRAVRIWAKQVKKVGITYFSFVFTIFFSL
jgi:hypothetical protein